jgi:hypothetical protein
MRKSDIFIPILSIPGLLMDNTRFHKKFSYYKLEERKPLNTDLYIAPLNGRAVLQVTIAPAIEKLKNWHINNHAINPVTLTALVDTGASISAIHKNKVKELNLKSYRGAEIAGLNSKKKQMRNVDLSVHLNDIFPDFGFLDICPVVVNFDATEPFDFIIGWDVLRFCTLQYNYPKGMFFLEFKGEYEKDEI